MERGSIMTLKIKAFLREHPHSIITRKYYLDHSSEPGMHRRYYAQFVNDAVKDMVITDMGGKEKLIAAYKKDEHFNSLPLYRWDSMAVALRSLYNSVGKQLGDYYSNAGAVCILKEAARQIVEENQ
jgi:hypothetical protein